LSQEQDSLTANAIRWQQITSTLGIDERHPPRLLISGTNGKGSTAIYTSALLTQSGLKVGLFTSPHLQSERERIVINGNAIPLSALKQLDDDLAVRCAALPDSVALTPFEVWTLKALLFFQEAAVDIMVMEIGVGGALDPTNHGTVLASAITSIDLDHTEILGDNRTAILDEKLPIARPRAPLIFGETDPQLVRHAAAWCASRRVEFLPLTVAANDFVFGEQPITLGDERTSATVQRARAIAFCLACIATGHRVRNFPIGQFDWNRVRLPARMHWVDRVVVDLAHNDAALGNLALQMARIGFNLIIAKPRNRNWGNGARQLFSAANSVFIPELSSYREHAEPYFSEPQEIFNDFPELRDKTMLVAKPHAVKANDVLELQVRNAMNLAAESSNKSTALLICGSSRVAGAALKLLEIDTAATPLYS
jgi:folylpolyglutamate synthase/dihydrofolate synthase